MALGSQKPNGLGAPVIAFVPAAASFAANNAMQPKFDVKVLALYGNSNMFIWNLPDGFYVENKAGTYQAWYAEPLEDSKKLGCLHNTEGPAQIWHSTNYCNYVLDGMSYALPEWALITNHHLCQYCHDFCGQKCLWK